MTVPKFKTFRIEAYKPGKSHISKIKNAIKLSANESALGVSPSVKKVLNSKNLILSKYPDSKAKDLEKKFLKNSIVILIRLFVGLVLMKLFK